jgi:hypothetical protein
LTRCRGWEEPDQKQARALLSEGWQEFGWSGERQAVGAREPVHRLSDGAGETYRFFALEMPHE